MKKITAIILAVGMMFSLMACGNNSPEKALDTALANAQSGDASAFQSVILSDDESSLDSSTDEHDQEMYLTLFKKITYKIGKAEITDDTAKVPVTITTLDMKTIMTNYLTEAFSNLMNKDFDGDTWIKNAMVAEDAVTTTLTATVPMIKTDGVWKINNAEDVTGFANALTGGLYDYAQSISDSFSK